MKRNLGDVAASDGTKKQNARVTRNRETDTVVIYNIPKNFNNSKLRKLFQQCGDINRLDMVLNQDSTSKIARIEFNNEEGAIAAMTKTLKLVSGNRITVKRPCNSTLWVTNFPPHYQIPDLRALFGSSFGICVSIRLPSLRFNSNRRFAYIDMNSAESAAYAIETLNNTKIGDYKLTVRLSNPNERTKRTDVAIIEGRELFVRPLDYKHVTLEKLQCHFSQFGEIESINMPNPNKPELDARNSGYAFITFRLSIDANVALQLNNTEFEGRKIFVNIADKKAYLDRKKLKQLLNCRKDMSHVISLFPLSDKLSKTHILNFVKHNACFLDDDMIKEIFLVTDHRGAVLVLKDEPLAAKLILALNGRQLEKQTLVCGSVRDLLKHSQSSVAPIKNITQIISARPKPASEPNDTKKKTNEDFRKMLFQHNECEYQD